MARPFDKGFPLTPGGTPISYRTNVNRQKTKKWTEAKNPDYGGDDWGDDDEYDPPPPTISKPTGLRQQGQSLPSASIKDKKAYGELPSIPGASSNPRGRANSFDEDDEKRNFSSATARQPSPPTVNAPSTFQGPATRFSQMGVSGQRSSSSLPPISTQQTNQLGSRKPSHQGASPIAESPIAESPNNEGMVPARADTAASGSVYSQRTRANTGDSASVYSQQPGANTADSVSVYSQPARANTGESSSLKTPASANTSSTVEYTNRRDFSPSAVPLPLSTRGTPAPQSPADGSAIRFPARKSSFGQSAAPDPAAEITRSPQEGSGAKPWVTQARSPSPGSRSAGGSLKALPFVRPADIYRRVEEERERDRQSMDSSRPSMDSIVGSRPRSSSLGNSADNVGDTRRRLSNSEGDEGASKSGRGLTPMLEPLRERKSEYGFDEFDTAKEIPPKIGEAPREQQTSQGALLGLEKIRKSSTSPKIPDLKRMSGFGDDLFSQTKPSESMTCDIEDQSTTFSDNHDLRNQPSLGFRTAVNQAFGRTSDSVPETPNSTTGSDFRRNNSGSTGTAGISPIMSRMSSAANADTRNKDLSEASETIEEAEEPDVSHDLAYAKNEPSLPEPRSIAAREQSFRPILPGGWTSYAPSATGTTPQSEYPPNNEATSPPKAQTPASEELEESLSVEDITPTTSRHSLPKSPTEAAATGAALTALAGASVSDEERKTDRDDSSSSGNRDVSSVSQPAADSSENVNPTTAIDPQSAPKPERASPELQLRPDIGNTAASRGSSRSPTPLPKDTPPEEKSDELPKPTVPLKKKTKDQFQDDSSEHSPRPQLAPSLSTVTRPHDEESDKLRKEIVKSLSPRSSGAAINDDTLLSEPSNGPEHSRESNYFPSEYDSYWATTAEEDAPAELATDEASAGGETYSHYQQPPSLVLDRPALGELDAPPIPPLSPLRSDQLGPRPGLQSKFSWERSTEDVTQSAHNPPQETPIVETGTDAAIAGVPAREEETSDLGHHRTSEEKDYTRASSYPIPSTPSEDGHPARSPVLQSSPLSDRRSQASVNHSPSRPSLSQSPHSSSSAMLTFKGIMNMKSAQGRIKEFDQLRQQWAAMPSGLDDWVSTMKMQHEEYANTTGVFEGTALKGGLPNASTRSKLAKAIGTAPTAQQPYFQQYLNASNPLIPSGSLKSGPNAQIGSQGFSPGSKLTSQQVQAKGKEFLHTAGVFGGKAGKVGKGLLVKGKRKLRGAGGEKTSPSPPRPKKEQRRSSWGFPLNLSRSPGRSEISKRRNSRDITPMLQQHQEKNNQSSSRTMNGRGHLDSNLDILAMMSGAVGSSSNLESQQTQQAEDTTAHQRYLSSVSHVTSEPERPFTRLGHEIQEHNDLSPPVPISKDQPSWDPFNSAPIVEEDGSYFEERVRPKPMLQLLHEGDNPKSGNVESDRHHVDKPGSSKAPAVPLLSERRRSQLNSGEPLREVKAFALPVVDTASMSEPSNVCEDAKNKALESPDLSDTAIGKNSSDRIRPESTSSRPDLKLETQLDQLAEPQMKSEAKSEVASETKPESIPKKHSLSNRPRGASYDARISPLGSENPIASILSRPRGASHGEQGYGSTGLSIMSMLNRPRGASLDVARVPESSQNVASTGIPERPRASTLGNSEAYSAQPTETKNPQFQIVPPASQVSRGPPNKDKSDSPARQSSFKGLPPIRRTSTFGFGFGSRQPKERFTIDDDDEDEPISPTGKSKPGQFIPEVTQASEASGSRGITGSNSSAVQTSSPERGMPIQNQLQVSPDTSARPNLALQYTENNQTTNGPTRGSDPYLNTPSPTNTRATGDLRQSQESWRPSPITPAQHAPNKSWDATLQHSTLSSLPPQRSRALSGPSFNRGPDILHHERNARSLGSQKAFEEPPSSAQRYPELFRPELVTSEKGDFPPSYYQAPLSRGEAFLPRQQTSEYEIAGVGPPADLPSPSSSRRNSSFFKEIGERIARTASREVSTPVSPQEGPRERIGSRGADSSVVSGDEQGKRSRRSSVFGNLTRTSKAGLGSPRSADSTVAHFPGSQTDLLNSPTLSTPNEKKTFLGLAEPKRLLRSSTLGMPNDQGKKNRFSGLKRMFNRNNLRDEPSPQATKELSHAERQPIESPRLSMQQPASDAPRPPSPSRHFLDRLGPQSDSSKTSRSRRPSASGLFGGMIGRRSQQLDRQMDGHHSPSPSPHRQTEQRPQKLSNVPSQQSEVSPQPPESSTQQGPIQPEPQPKDIPLQKFLTQQKMERGRTINRALEPHYDTVPIPGGYSLVRAQGGHTVPTDYDPHGFNNRQISPRNQLEPTFTQSSSPQVQQGSEPQNSPDNLSPPPSSKSQPKSRLSNRPPPLNALEIYEDYQRRHTRTRRLSNQELIARSPARIPKDQQRPYQLSLPGQEDSPSTSPSRGRPRVRSGDKPLSPPKQLTKTPPLNLSSPLLAASTPELRHPESPAGYPLPGDETFSPVNEAARNISLPPLPPSDNHILEQTNGHLQAQSELQRSNSAISQISGLSAPSPRGLGIGIRTLSPGSDEENGKDLRTPSPTPPSGHGSPVRSAVLDEPASIPASISLSEDVTRQIVGEEEQQIEKDQHRNSKQSLNLYNASPTQPHPPATSSILAVSKEEITTTNGNGTTNSPVPPHPETQLSEKRMNEEASKTGPSMIPHHSFPLQNSFSKANSQKRKLRAEIEEKIVVAGQGEGEGDKIVVENYGQDGRGGNEMGEEQEEMVEMSAISYPGLEWNPYKGFEGEEGWVND